MVIGDAHQYLLDHFKEFNIIWSSPPCPTHSRARFGFGVCGHGYDYEYPDMSLYQEVIALKHLAKECKWVVENVIPYYKYIVEPSIILGRHAYWSNFGIMKKKFSKSGGIAGNTERKDSHVYFDVSKYGMTINDKALRNCVDPELGLHILNMATGAIPPIQEGLFSKQEDSNG